MNRELKEVKKNMFKNVLRYVLPLCMFTLMSLMASTQKSALIDMEYILKSTPACERAGERLNQVSKKRQAKVEALNTEASTIYKNYQGGVVFLPQDQRKKRQEAVMAKEKRAFDLKRGYFDPEGELFEKHTSLITPIQGEIHNAVKDISDQHGYNLVIDRSNNAAGITYDSPRVGISNEVLQKLGYSYQ